MKRSFLLYGCPEMRRRWWAPEGEDPPKLPEGHVWLVLARVEETS